MNIFEVLNSGGSRLHEPSLSSFLGYLLDSTKNHGLGDTFIRLFLQLINNASERDIFDKKILKNSIISDVSLEEPYQIYGHQKNIDIQISLLNNDKDEVYRIIIENKIRVNSASQNQLKEYYEAVIKNETSLKNLLIVFLTPFSENRKSKEEYENLKIDNKFNNHNKCWIYWNNPKSPQNCLINLFKNLLKKELRGEINPINEYLRHTLKAFIKFTSELTESKKIIRFGEDIGNIVEKRDIKIDDKLYTIIRRSSNQIQVLHNGEKVVAKEILRRIIKEYKLDIPYENTYSLTTRQLGKLVLEKLKNKKRGK